MTPYFQNVTNGQRTEAPTMNASRYHFKTNQTEGRQKHGGVKGLS